MRPSLASFPTFVPISRPALLMSACLTFAGFGAPVMAQEAEEDNVAVLGRVLVTAERKEGFLQETPIAVSAITSETLENLQVDTTQDLQRVVPGLKLLEVTSNPSNFQVSLRGSTQQDSSLVVAESPVGFYVDDIYIARLNGANAQLADIERVEVLRGPQGTLYGRNTLAGAVKLVTAQPGDDVRVRASVGAGEFGAYQAKGAVSGPIGGGWSASIAGLVDGFDGYYTNIADDSDWGAQENSAVRAKLRYDNGGAFTAQGFISFASSDNDGYVPSFAIFPALPQSSTDDITLGLGDPFAVNFAPNPALPSPIEAQPRGETEQTIVGLDLSYDLGWATARSITGYVETDDFFSIEFTGVGAFPGANLSMTEQFSQEFQLLGDAYEGSFDWLLGAYIFSETADQRVALISDDALAVDTDSFSIFGQGTYAMNEDLSVTLGARWTRDEKDFQGTIRQLVTLAPLFPTVDLSNSFEAFTPKLGIDYKLGSAGIIDSGLLYASVSGGFKSGGSNGIAFGSLDVLSTPYDEETNTTYEVGFKSDLFGNRLRANAAAYLNDISDITMTAQSTGPGGVSFPVQNSGDAEVKGLELELLALPMQGLNLFANVTLQDAEYTDLNPGSAAAFAELQFGSVTLPQISDISYSVGANYTFQSPFQNSGEISLGVDHFYTDDYFIGASNDFLIESYSRSNAFAAYRFNDNWEARIEVSNIDDGLDIPTGAPIFSAVAVAPPRQAMFTLSYRN